MNRRRETTGQEHEAAGLAAWGNHWVAVYNDGGVLPMSEVSLPTQRPFPVYSLEYILNSVTALSIARHWFSTHPVTANN